MKQEKSLSKILIAVIVADLIIKWATGTPNISTINFMPTYLIALAAGIIYSGGIVLALFHLIFRR